MLTKDLVRFIKKDGSVIPLFLTEKSAGFYYADQTLDLLSSSVGKTRRELDEIFQPIIKSSKIPKVVKGLYKLLLDISEFSIQEEKDLSRKRELLFEKSASIIKTSEFQKYSEYKNIIQNFLKETDIDSGKIYSDHPDNQKIVGFKKISSEELLNRYNLAIVQSLLLYTSSIKITLSAITWPKLNSFLRYLKFFGLVAKLEDNTNSFKETVKSFIFHVDGPLSIFENSNKYGLRLASFFPVIPLFKQWKLDAVINIDGVPLNLSLNELSGLKSHYKKLSSYIPEEIKMFYNNLRNKTEDWSISSDSEILNLGEQKFVIPDFTILSKNRKSKIFLFFFNRWNCADASNIMKRISELKIPAIFGIEKHIEEKMDLRFCNESFDEKINASFTYREYPGVQAVLKQLNLFL